VKAIEAMYQKIPEGAAYSAIAGFPTVVDGNAILRLKQWQDRTRKQQQIADELRPKFAALPGVIAFPVNPPSFGQSAAIDAGRVRHHVAGSIRGTVADLRPLHRRDAEVSGDAESAIGPAPEYARDPGARQTATSSPTSAPMSTPSGARSKRCWAGGR
jgi:hypothetical protein